MIPHRMGRLDVDEWPLELTPENFEAVYQRAVEKHRQAVARYEALGQSLTSGASKSNTPTPPHHHWLQWVSLKGVRIQRPPQ